MNNTVQLVSPEVVRVSSNMTPAITSLQRNFSTFVTVFSVLFYTAVILLGTAGNLLGILVFRSTRAMHMSRTVFTALAVADTAALWVNPLRYWLRYVLEWDIRSQAQWTCRTHTFLSYLSTDCATYVLCLLTLERYFYARFPHKSRLLWKGSKKIAVWSVVFGSLLVKNAFLLGKVDLVRNEVNQTICDTHDLRFRHVFFYLHVVSYSLIPSVLLLGLNVGLLRTLQLARKRQVYLLADHRQTLSEGPTATQSFLSTPQPSQHLSVFLVNLHRSLNEMHSSKGHIAGPDEISRDVLSTTAATSAPESRSVRCLKAPSSSLANLNKSLHYANRLLVPVGLFHLATTLPLCVFSIIEDAKHWKMQNRDSQWSWLYNVAALLIMLNMCSNACNSLIYFLSSRVFRKRLRNILRRHWLTLRSKCCRCGQEEDSNMHHSQSSTFHYQCCNKNITPQHQISFARTPIASRGSPSVSGRPGVLLGRNISLVSPSTNPSVPSHLLWSNKSPFTNLTHCTSDIPQGPRLTAMFTLHESGSNSRLQPPVPAF